LSFGFLVLPAKKKKHNKTKPRWLTFDRFAWINWVSLTRLKRSLLSHLFIFSLFKSFLKESFVPLNVFFFPFETGND
jgi:hypothetical protein